MKHHRRVFLVLVLLLLVGGMLLVPSVRWPIYGWLRGEAFYQDMPTSWWASEIRERYQHFPYELVVDNKPDQGPLTWHVVARSPLWDQVWQQLKTTSPSGQMWDVEFGGPLLDGDLAALPVLLALIRNDSAKVRRVAISGLYVQGKERPEVVAALVEAAEDPDNEARQDARVTLQLLEPEDAAKAGVK